MTIIVKAAQFDSFKIKTFYHEIKNTAALHGADVAHIRKNAL
ncbi:hypothetical protein ACI0FM_04045 [Paenochrobactrum sp. BZR 588]